MSTPTQFCFYGNDVICQIEVTSHPRDFSSTVMTSSSTKISFESCSFFPEKVSTSQIQQLLDITLDEIQALFENCLFSSYSSRKSKIIYLISLLIN